MSRKPFVPARSSRHRAACFALYRALVRSGKQIPLPADVLASGRIHPVKYAVRRQFDRNRPDVSLRLVYAALAAGYKFLSVFEQAKTEGSKHWNDVVSFLRAKKTSADGSRAKKAAIEASKPPPHAQARRPPFLTRLAPTADDPDAPPAYVVTSPPHPAGSLSGRRGIPRLAATSSGGFPFLRLGGPQPEGLSWGLRWRLRRNVRRVELAVRLADADTENALEEDEWERLVATQASREGLGDIADPGNGFSSFVEEGLEVTIRQLNMERVDNIARAAALMKKIDEEKELARIEEGMRQASIGDGKGP